jgi:His-Xaa-Ser system protein HxsD
MTDKRVERFSVGVYGHESILRAAHKFTDRCYIHLEPEGEDAVLVEFRSRGSAQPLEDLIGEFCNEVIDQHIRASVLAETIGLRDKIVSAAFGEGGIVSTSSRNDA